MAQAAAEAVPPPRVLTGRSSKRLRSQSFFPRDPRLTNPIFAPLLPHRFVGEAAQEMLYLKGAFLLVQ